jgi:hypothetical protein
VASFATALGAHLETKKKPKLLERRLLKILNAAPSKRRTAILKALETRARDKLGVGATQAIDWSAVDWQKILDFLLKLLVILLPLFI